MDSPKPRLHPKTYREGPDAARRFDTLVQQVIVVPHEKIKKRQQAWEKARKKQRKKAG